MSSLSEVKQQLVATLAKAGIERREAICEAGLIVEHATGLTAAQQVIKSADAVDDEQVRVMQAIVARRGKREPLQYCLGHTYFMGFRFVVRPGVLIPRSDTETLASLAIERLSGKASARAADIGCGSGAIAITAAKRLPGLHVCAIDISPESIALTRENALALGVLDRLEIRHNDWMQALPFGLDAILANPPYIPRSQAGFLAPEVIKFEPEQALFGEDSDGLGFFRSFSQRGRKHLSDGGFIALEFGDGQAASVEEIFAFAGWQQIAVHNDLNGLPRVLTAS